MNLLPFKTSQAEPLFRCSWLQFEDMKGNLSLKPHIAQWALHAGPVKYKVPDLRFSHFLLHITLLLCRACIEQTLTVRLCSECLQEKRGRVCIVHYIRAPLSFLCNDRCISFTGQYIEGRFKMRSEQFHVPFSSQDAHIDVSIRAVLADHVSVCICIQLLIISSASSRELRGRKRHKSAFARAFFSSIVLAVHIWGMLDRSSPSNAC